jgi:hypothetical protein
MKKDEAINSMIKSIREFDPSDQNEILHAIATSVITERQEQISTNKKKLRDLEESYEQLPVLLKI